MKLKNVLGEGAIVISMTKELSLAVKTLVCLNHLGTTLSHFVLLVAEGYRRR